MLLAPLDVPDSPGVYCLYQGPRLIHVGMAAGAATLCSEIRAHARGDYGPRTQEADRVEWEVAPDALLAYRRFLALYSAFSGAASDAPPSASGRYSSAAT